VTNMKVGRPLKAHALILLLTVPILLAPSSASADEFKITTRVIEDRKAVFATVQSVDRILARARISGTLSGLTIDEGAKVLAGEKIAVITDKKLPLKLTALEAKLKSLAAQEKLAETDFKRVKSLRRTGAASQARLDASATNLDIIKSEFAALSAERSVIRQQIAEGEVVAPVTGRVLAVAVTNRSVVMPGETIAVIAQDRYILRLELPERHARFLRAGVEVQVSQRGLSGKIVAAEATVQQVYPEMERGRVIADVKVSGLGDYFVGERTRVHIATGTRSIIAAPARFFRQQFGITFAKLKNGEEVTLRLGQPLPGNNRGEVEVLSGLKTGDVLVTP